MASSGAKASATAGTVNEGPNAERLGSELSASANIGPPKNQTRPAMMRVYRGARVLGTVEDFGVNRVVATSFGPDGPVRLGAFRDRRSARLAIEAHHGLGGAQ
jgi:hypothetical protein